MNNVTQVLKQYIIDEFLATHGENTLEENRPLVEDGIIDSLGLFLLSAFIEEQFKVTVQSEELVLDNFESLATISSFVNQKIAEQSAE